MRDGRRTVEAGTTGAAKLPASTPSWREITQTEYIVQLSGEAIKIGADPMKAEFNRNGNVDVMLRYNAVSMAQISPKRGMQPVPSKSTLRFQALAAGSSRPCLRR